MDKEQLQEVLRLHKLWIMGDGNGKKANLGEADLTRANLREADLTRADLGGADLDFSCWPLWCGSLGIKGDEGLVGQLAYHLFDLLQSSGIEVKSLKKLKELANKSSPVTRYGKEKIC